MIKVLSVSAACICRAVEGLPDEQSGALRIPQPGREATPHGALPGQLALSASQAPCLLAAVSTHFSLVVYVSHYHMYVQGAD